MPEDDNGGKWKVLEVLVTSRNLILVIGGILVLLGAASGVTYNQWFPITDLGWRILLVVAGFVVETIRLLIGNVAPSSVE